MLPIVIYECPNTITPDAAGEMAYLATTIFERVAQRPNKIPGKDVPIVCCSTAGVQGFWSLECNDPEIPRDVLDEVVRRIRNAKIECVESSFEGPHFTKWRIDALKVLVCDIAERFADTGKFRIWYDRHEDYHCMSCEVNGQPVTFHYYKVCRVTVGDEVRRYPASNFTEIPHAIKTLLETQNANDNQPTSVN